MSDAHALCASNRRAATPEEREIQIYREKGWEDKNPKGSSVTVSTNSGAPVVASTSSSGPAERTGVNGPALRVSCDAEAYI